MAEPVVLDASAVLAVIANEPGRDVVLSYLPGALISSINLAEIVSSLADRGANEMMRRTRIANLGLSIVPFDEEAAYLAGALRIATRGVKLSLADRACLSLALLRGHKVVTTDRVWARLGLKLKVELIR